MSKKSAVRRTLQLPVMADSTPRDTLLCGGLHTPQGKECLLFVCLFIDTSLIYSESIAGYIFESPCITSTFAYLQIEHCKLITLYFHIARQSKDLAHEFAMSYFLPEDWSDERN